MERRRTPFTYQTEVRYADCDMHQHMNHAAYFSFFEQARVAFWKHLGLLQKRDDFHSIPLIIAAAHCEYKAPAYLNDIVVVSLWPSKIGTKSFQLDFEMTQAETKTLLATGYTVQVMYDYAQGKSVPITQELKNKLSAVQPRPPT